MSQPDRKERAVVCLLVLWAIFWRVQKLDQPIVENYVGRQIPTAMVARNLARGSGFLSPELDTGPFPNKFLVEPPIYAQIVAWISRLIHAPLEPAGRAISAVFAGLAVCGLYRLVRRRSEGTSAIASALIFASFPVLIRYGRAFQPDVMTMSLAVLGLALWDGEGRIQRIFGGSLLAIAVAQKVYWAIIVVPLMIVLRPTRSVRSIVASTAIIIPVVAWYLYAASQAQVDASAASSDNAARWASALGLHVFFEPHRYLNVAKDLAYRAFTPIGGILIGLGLLGWKQVDLLWKVWIGAAAFTLVLLFGKLHHDYYWLILAPPAAAWSGVGLDWISQRSRGLAIASLVALVLLGIWQTRATWKTPPEWQNAQELGEAIIEETPPNRVVIGPEAIIYLGDRRGCRLEYEPSAVVRAANEWRPETRFVETDPFALVQFYRRRHEDMIFADVRPEPSDNARRRLHDRIREIPGIWIYDDHGGRFVLIGLPKLDR